MRNHKIKFVFILCLFAIVSTLFIFETPAHSENSKSKKILILNSLSKGNDLNGFNTWNWNDEIISGLESKLKENKSNIELKVEYMDSTSNSSDEYYQMLYNLYKYKYTGTNFDTIIVLSNNAIDFIDKYADDLFPNTPIIFSGVDQSRTSLINNHPLFTGLYKSQDYGSTIDLALTLHPNAKHFFMITSDKTYYDKMLEPLIPSYKNKIDFKFCTDTDINIVKEKINELSDDTIIFIGNQFYNSADEPISVPEATNILFKNCRFPVYSTGYSYLNNGIVGGMITYGTKLGGSIGTITTRILNGEKPSDIPVIIDDSHNYVLDYNQLNRFNIKMSSIPKDAEIINLPPSTYSISINDLSHILAIFISVLILIIIFLLFTIRKLRNTKQMLSNSESLLKTIINSTPDIICFKNPNGQLLKANNSILRLLNITKRDYKFKSFSELNNLSSIKNNDLITFENYDKKCWECANIFRTEEIITTDKENIHKTYDMLRIPLFNKDKTHLGLVIIGRDITEHKANEQNKKIINELRYYDKLKIEFFTNLSHELRTPLNVIFSALQVMDETLKNNDNRSTSNHNDINNTNIITNSNKINKYINIMKQNCYRLIRLINNFLDLSKIDSENFSIKLQNSDIINIVESIVLSVADYVESKGLSIVFDTEVEEKIISCDPNIIERIMLNLLSNAVKFTPKEGSITINIYCQNDDVLISVKDTGIGIPLKKQEAIFKKFVQVDKSLSRNREGSGIGLSLVKSLVELHDGTITLVSSPDNGSEFILKFPSEPLSDTKTSVSDYNLNKNSAEIIKMEFSDIYS